jgi:hypothetical protein
VLGFRGGEVAFLPGLDASVLTRGTIAAETGHRGVVTSLAFNSSGELAASGGSEGVVRVWNTRSGAREPALLRHPAGPVAGLVFSADDRWLVSAGPTSVRVFALPVGGPASASAEPATEIRLGAKPQAVALAANNRILAVGDSAGDIVLAAPDGSTGEITVRGGSPVTALAFGPGSGVLASGSAAGDLVLWDTLTVAAIGSALAFNAPIGWIAFSPDGSTLYLRSGGWLHVVERGQDGARVIASSLLPAGLRDAPALSLVRDGRAIRALAHAGGGYLNYQEIPTVAEVAAVPAAAAGVARSSLADRDWRRILGLELDPVTDSIRKLGF